MLTRCRSALAGVLALAALGPARAADPKPFPGTPTKWHGFARHDFKVDGTDATVVVPDKPFAGRPWVWRGEFFGAFADADVALIKAGWHLAYLKVPDLFGSPKAMAKWETFHKAMTGEYGLHPRPGLIGLSRGGLYCLNWAAAHPDRTLAVYLDNAVCDFRSWPGGKPKGLGTGPGSEAEWKKLLAAYDFKSDAEATAYKLNPVDNLAPLAKAKIPFLLVYGDADTVVPVKENSEVVFERYTKLGGPVERVVKPGQDHHPHGLKDVTPVVEFFTKALAAGGSSDGPGLVSEARRAEDGFLVHEVRSPLQAGTTLIRVLQPGAPAAGRRLPVVYLLPVEAGSEHRYGDGLAEVKKLDLANKLGAVFVAPTFSHIPWYADHPTDRQRAQETYFLTCVVPFVEKTYPVKAGPGRRLLLGFSKSGWGAFTLLLRHPDVFGRAAAWDAPLMFAGPDKYGSKDIFGTAENFTGYQVSRLLEANAERLKDGKRLVLLGYGNFRADHQKAHELLDRLKVPHEYRDGPERKHDWHSGWVAESAELLLAPEGRR